MKRKCHPFGGNPTSKIQSELHFPQLLTQKYAMEKVSEPFRKPKIQKPTLVNVIDGRRSDCPLPLHTCLGQWASFGYSHRPKFSTSAGT